MWSNLYLIKISIILILCTITSSICDSTDISDIESTTTESSSLISTSEMISDEAKEELTTVKSPTDEKSHLPVDLLSEGVLLDPNVVLARLSRRDINYMYKSRQPEYSYGYTDWYRPHRPMNRQDQYNFKREIEPRQRYIPKKMKIYPVFPGK